MFSVNLALLLVSCLFLADLVFSEEEVTDAKTHDDSLFRTKRAGLNMLRLGRGLQMLRMGKRAEFPMLRMGRSEQQYTTDEDDAIRQLIIDILTQQAADRDYYYPEYYPYPPPQSRYRRSVSEFPEKEIGMSDFQKLTEGGEEEMKQQEAENFPVIEGYPVFADDIEYKNEDEKRPMSMLRMGKRPMNMLRLGKRPMSMLRMGKRPMSMLRMGKRPMSMLRMGKRPMSMLRMGKRPMSMLQMGKRPMSMLRMGKRPMSMLRMGKRPMSMLRMGKRPMSMLRMGKKSEEDHSLEARKINMLRLGRSD